MAQKRTLKTPKPKNIRWPRDEACTIDLIKKVPLKSTTKQQLFNSLITLERICRRQQRTIFHLSESSRHNLNSKRIAYLNLKIHLKNLDDEWREYTKDLREKHEDCLEKNKEILKSHNEITRAYNGLHTIGEMAQDLGLDIKKHNEMLPENNKDYQFSQKHTLLESGKVRHEYRVIPKKKPNGEDK